MKVFISSTYDDLMKFREVVKEAVSDRQWTPMMIDPGERTVFAECRAKVAESDLFILLIAFRRGWVPTVEEGGDGSKSITELELDAAREADVPVYLFKARDSWPGSHWERSALEEVMAFRESINQVPTWFTAEGVQDEQVLAGPAFRNSVDGRLIHFAGKTSREATPKTLQLRCQAVRRLPDRPYPVLEPVRHPALLVGREQALKDAAGTLRLPGLILSVYAVSGIGKSSFLRAGLLPSLQDERIPVVLNATPDEPGLARSLVCALFELDPANLGALDHELFAEYVTEARRLSGFPPVFVLDQFEDALRRDSGRALATIGPLIAATAVHAEPDYPCRWVLSYRQEHHGAVRKWLRNILREARAWCPDVSLTDLPTDLSRQGITRDLALAPLGEPSPSAENPEKDARGVFLNAILQPLAAKREDGTPAYSYKFENEDARELAAAFAAVRVDPARSDAPLAPELQVVLQKLVRQAKLDDDGETKLITLPSGVSPNDMIAGAIDDHLRRQLDTAFDDRATRTQALLILGRLADAEGRREHGILVQGLEEELGDSKHEILTTLQHPEVRLLVTVQSQDDLQLYYALPHDVLANLVRKLLKEQVSRKKYGLDEELLELQREILPWVDLHQLKSESATHPNVALVRRIQERYEDIVWDQRSHEWWLATSLAGTVAAALRGRRRLARTAIAISAFVVLVVAYVTAVPSFVAKRVADAGSYESAQEAAVSLEWLPFTSDRTTASLDRRVPDLESAISNAASMREAERLVSLAAAAHQSAARGAHAEMLVRRSRDAARDFELERALLLALHAYDILPSSELARIEVGSLLSAFPSDIARYHFRAHVFRGGAQTTGDSLTVATKRGFYQLANGITPRLVLSADARSVHRGTDPSKLWLCSSDAVFYWDTTEPTPREVIRPDWRVPTFCSANTRYLAVHGHDMGTYAQYIEVVDAMKLDEPPAMFPGRVDGLMCSWASNLYLCGDHSVFVEGTWQVKNEVLGHFFGSVLSWSDQTGILRDFSENTVLARATPGFRVSRLGDPGVHSAPTVRLVGPTEEHSNAPAPWIDIQIPEGALHHTSQFLASPFDVLPTGQGQESRILDVHTNSSRVSSVSTSTQTVYHSTGGVAFIGTLSPGGSRELPIRGLTFADLAAPNADARVAVLANHYTLARIHKEVLLARSNDGRVLVQVRGGPASWLSLSGVVDLAISSTGEYCAVATNTHIHAFPCTSPREIFEKELEISEMSVFGEWVLGMTEHGPIAWNWRKDEMANALTRQRNGLRLVATSDELTVSAVDTTSTLCSVTLDSNTEYEFAPLPSSRFLLWSEEVVELYAATANGQEPCRRLSLIESSAISFHAQVAVHGERWAFVTDDLLSVIDTEGQDLRFLANYRLSGDAVEVRFFDAGSSIDVVTSLSMGVYVRRIYTVSFDETPNLRDSGSLLSEWEHRLGLKLNEDFTGSLQFTE